MCLITHSEFFSKSVGGAVDEEGGFRLVSAAELGVLGYSPGSSLCVQVFV